MTASLAGQVHWVTGAASGIGAHLVQELLQRGAHVCATDIATDAMAPLRALATPDQLLLVTLDVRDPDQWHATAAEVLTKWSRLDVLMNVAGVIRPGYVQQFDVGDVHLQLDVNAKGVIFGTQAAARVMAEQGHGHILNIASLAGVAPVPGLSLYSASKFAVRGFSLAAAMELKPQNIYLTVICPDAVQTPMLDQQVNREEAAMTFSGRAQPLTVSDIAAAVFDRALSKRPLEITLPASRGAMAKFGSAFPASSGALMSWLRARGRRRQQRVLRDL